jgi:hypothetical protein
VSLLKQKRPTCIFWAGASLILVVIQASGVAVRIGQCSAQHDSEHAPSDSDPKPSPII